MATLRISAKCSDLFSARLTEPVRGNPSATNCIGEYDGYVPAWLPNPNEEHYGDYVQLDIDVETGQILNWKKPTKRDLAIFKPAS